MAIHTRKTTHNSFLFGFLILFNSFAACAQEIGINEVRPLFPFKGRFEFEIANNSNTIYKYYVSLESFMNDSSWREIRTDLFINQLGRK
jgi:hypothetical protein